MNVLKKLFLLICVSMGLFLAICVLAVVSQVWDYALIERIIALIYQDQMLRMLFGSIAIVTMLLNIILYQKSTMVEKKDKIIAFDNPSGRVSVSLLALEDLIKKTAAKISDIREVKANIAASKKGGIQVTMSLTLRSDLNIPDITAKVQDSIKRKIVDTIGLEESVNVSIFVSKILAEPMSVEKKDASVAEHEDVSDDAGVPFHGYRA